MFLSHSNAVPKMHANYLDKRSSYKEYTHGQKICEHKEEKKYFTDSKVEINNVRRGRIK